MLGHYSTKTMEFLSNFSMKYCFVDIREKINSIENQKVLIIGDGIIDEYHYCEPIGKAAKAPIVVNKYLSHEIFAGGAFAIANHVAGICKDVHLVTLLGKDNSKEDFILKNLKPNIEIQFFYRDDGPTIVKKRYIEEYRYNKLFEINYINDFYINKSCENEIIDYTFIYCL